MNNVAFIFPGQGAQYVGMGKDFYTASTVARQTFQEASSILGVDYEHLILEGPQNDLLQTKYSQPAIFITSVALLRALLEKFPHLKPTVCAGLSLGEYTALYASGRISFAEGLKLVAARGQYMQDACHDREGTMRVVLGLDPGVVEAHLPNDVWIANLNCPGQVVIAGATSAMPAAEEALKAQGAKRVLPLDVSGAFHTPLMQSAQERLKPYLLNANLQESSTGFVMNVPGDFVSTSEAIRNHLIAQVASPTRWEKGVRALDAAGVDLYIEIGPGKTLTGMNKKIGVRGMTLSIEKVTDFGTLEQLYASQE